MAWQDRITELAANPITVSTASGVINGVLVAVVRGKEFTPTAAYITSAVTAAGEVALVLELPKEERPDMVWFFAQCAFGTLIGLSPFVSWQKGRKNFLQWAGEAIADKAPVPEAA